MDRAAKSMIAILCCMVFSMISLESAYANAPAAKVDVNSLPSPHVRVGNKIAENTVSVILDPRCHYCKKLYEKMKADKETQYNIYISTSNSSQEIGKDYYAHAIYCAENRKDAVDDAFSGRPIDAKAATYECDLSGMIQLSEFIEQNNLFGSPIAIFSDGEVKMGSKATNKSIKKRRESWKE